MELVRKRSPCWRSVGSGWEDAILPGREDPPNCADPPYLRSNKWELKLGKIECVFVLWDWMIWDGRLSTWGLPNIYSLPLSISQLPMNLCTPLSNSPSRSSLFLPAPAITQFSVKLSGSGGEKWGFLLHCPYKISYSIFKWFHIRIIVNWNASIMYIESLSLVEPITAAN